MKRPLHEKHLSCKYFREPQVYIPSLNQKYRRFPQACIQGMRMKKSLAIIAFLLIIVVGSYQFMNTPESLTGSEEVITDVSEVEESAPVVISRPATAEKLPEKITTPNLSHILKPYDDAPESARLMIDEKKREIEGLMHEFNSHLADVDMRKSIKIKIDKALAEYNEIILPFAVEQVRASN